MTPERVAALLRELREAGAGEAVAALASRVAEHAALDDPDPERVAVLLMELRRAGAGEAVAALASRVGDAGGWQLSLEADPHKARQYVFGREPDGAASVPWDSQDHDRLGLQIPARGTAENPNDS